MSRTQANTVIHLLDPSTPLPDTLLGFLVGYLLPLSVAWILSIEQGYHTLHSPIVQGLDLWQCFTQPLCDHAHS